MLSVVMKKAPLLKTQVWPGKQSHTLLVVDHCFIVYFTLIFLDKCMSSSKILLVSNYFSNG